MREDAVSWIKEPKRGTVKCQWASSVSYSLPHSKSPILVHRLRVERVMAHNSFNWVKERRDYNIPAKYAAGGMKT